MFQDPQGRGQGRGGPGPAIQEPQGQQPPAITKPRLPALDPIELPPMGADSPPIMEAMQGMPQAPPEPPNILELPDVLPSNPADAEALLQAIEQSLQQAVAYQNYQYYKQAAMEMQAAPMAAEQLMQMSYESAGDEEANKSIQGDMESLEPFLPKTTARNLRAHVTNVPALKKILKDFGWRYEAAVRTHADPYRRIKESELKGADKARVNLELQKHEKWRREQYVSSLSDFERSRLAAVHGGEDQIPAPGMPKETSDRMWQSKAREVLGKGYKVSTAFQDVWRGLKGFVSDEQTVDDVFAGIGSNVAEEMLEPYKVNPATGKRRLPLPEGWDEDMLRSALAQEAMRKLPEVRGHTEFSDLATGFGSVIGWAVPAMGEIRILGKAVEGAKWLEKIAKVAPRTARFIEGSLVYAGGPAAIEGAYAYMRGLPPSEQAQVDAAMDPQLKEMTELGFRTMNMIRDASTALLFGLGDIARVLRGNEGALSHPIKSMASAAGIGLAAPAAMEGTEVGIGWMADALAKGEGTRWDAMQQLRAARGDFKPASTLLKAIASGDLDKVWDAALEYGKHAAPMAAGIASIHGLVATGTKLTNRAQMMRLRRMAYDDADKAAMSILLYGGQMQPANFGNMSKAQLEAELARSGIANGRESYQALRDIMRGVIDSELKKITKSKKEDRRAALKESIDKVTEGRSEQHVDAEKAADELVPDRDGSVTEKLSDAQKAVSEAETAEEQAKAQRDVEVLTQLDEAKGAKDRPGALTSVERARERADELDRMLREEDVEPAEDQPKGAEEPSVSDQEAKPEAIQQDAMEGEIAQLDKEQADLLEKDTELRRKIEIAHQRRDFRAASELAGERRDLNAAGQIADDRARVEELRGGGEPGRPAEPPRPKTLEEGVRARAERSAADLSARPDAADEHLERADRDLRRQWEIVSYDEDAGEYIIRDADDPKVRLKVSEDGIEKFNFAEKEVPPEPTPETVKAATESPDAPVPMPRVKSAREEAAMAAIKQMLGAGENVSVRAVGEKLGTSRSTTARVMKALEEAGMLGRKGKRYVLPEDAAPASSKASTEEVDMAPTKRQEAKLEKLRPDEARYHSQAVIENELEAHLRGIEAEIFGSDLTSEGPTGIVGDEDGGYQTIRGVESESTVGYEAGASERIRRLVDEYAETRDPENPRRAKIHLVAQLMGRLGQEHVTEARLTETFGLDKDDVLHVRMAMEGIRPLTDPEITDAQIDNYGVGAWERVISPRPASKGAVTVGTDWVRAMRQPDLHAVDSSIGDAYNKAIEAGESEADAARSAWDQMSRIRSATGDGVWGADYATFVDGHAMVVEDLHRAMHSSDPEVHRDAMDEFAKLINQTSTADDITAALSMSAQGRAQLFRMFELAATIRLEGQIPSPFAMERIPRFADKPRARKTPQRTLETARQRHLRYLQERLQEVNRQSGAASPGLVLGSILAGPFIGMVKAADWTLRASRWGVNKAAKAIVDGTAQLLLDPIHKPGTAYTRWTHRRMLRRLEALRNLKAGKVPGYASRFGIFGSQLSQHSDPDFVMLNEFCMVGHKIAIDLGGQLHRVFGEDSIASRSLNRWIELDGKRTEKDDGTIDDSHLSQEEKKELERIEAENMSAEQVEVAKTVRDMYQHVRRLVAERALPDQILRKRLHKQYSEAEAMLRDKQAEYEDQVEEALQNRNYHKKLAKEKLGLDGEALKDYMHEHERWLANAREAAKRAKRKADAKASKAQSVMEDLGRVVNEWGITRGFVPAILNMDPDEASRILREKGVDDISVETESGLLKLTAEGRAEELRRLQESVLDDYVLDHTLNDVPDAIRSQHWRKRNEVLEAMGMRELDGVRTFTHYMRDIFRLLPAVAWTEKHGDRLYGRERLVTEEELLAGVINGTVRVKRIMVGDNKVVMRMDGSAVALQMRSKDGKSDHTLWFRSVKDAQRVMKMDPNEVADRLGKRHVGRNVIDWEFPKNQNFGRRVILQPELHGQKAKRSMAFDTREEGLIDRAEEDSGLGDLKIGEYAQVKWPTHLLGNATIREGGELRDWHKNAGKPDMLFHSAYYEEGINTVLGRQVYTNAQRVARIFGTVASQMFLGLANPFMAFKEVIQQTFFNTVAIGAPRSLQGAVYAMEFSRVFSSMNRALNNRARAAQWLKDYRPKYKDGNFQIDPTALIGELTKSVRDPLMRDAFIDFVSSPISAESVDQHYMEMIREMRYGQPLYRWSKSNWYYKVGKGALNASWYLRRMAQTHGQRQCWFASYITSRKNGDDRATAMHQANMFALRQGNISNRLSQPKFFATAAGIFMKPLASWQAHISSIGWRDLTGQYRPDRRFLERLTTFGKRAAALFVSMYMAQQMGMMAGFDPVRAIGGGLSEVPLIGPKATYSLHEVQNMLGMYSDPADPSRRPVGWRETSADLVKQYAPDWLQEFLIRRVETAGALPADLAVTPHWGTWIPLSGSVLSSVGQWLNATFTGNEKDADRYGGELVRYIAFYNWMSTYNRLFGVMPDPLEPSYVQRVAPGTGITVDRMSKSFATRAASLAFGMPELRSSIARIDRTLQGVRDEKERAKAVTSSYNAQRLWVDSKRYIREAQEASTPEARAIAQERADDLFEQFRTNVLEHAIKHKFTYGEMRELRSRWEREALSSTQLTSGDRSIVYAYNNKMGFQRMTAALNGRGFEGPMSEARFQAVRKVWFSDDAYLKARRKLATQHPEVWEYYRDSLAAARVRWGIEKGKLPQPKRK